jgi:outer membrane protein assembly factor BamB
VQLAPPLQPIARWSKRGVGYVPLVGHGLVFLSFTTGAIAAFDERTADEVWRFPLPRPYVPVASKEGAYLLHDDWLLVFVGEDLVVLEARTGQLVARRPAPRLDLWGAVKGDGDNQLICQFEFEKQLWIGAYDLATGDIAWKRRCTRLNALLTAADGRVFYCPDRGTLSALDVSSGEPQWEVSARESGKFVDPVGESQTGDFVGVRIAVDGLVIAAVQGHHVVAIDAASGEQRWLRRLETANPFNLTWYPDGRLHIVGPSFFHVLDGRTGDLLVNEHVAAAFKSAAVSAPFTSLAATDDHLYFGDFLKNLIGWSIERREIAWRVQTKSRLRLLDAPLALAHRLYVLDEGGNLYAFES